jgi:hypothetical protein
VVDMHYPPASAYHEWGFLIMGMSYSGGATLGQITRIFPALGTQKQPLHIREIPTDLWIAMLMG